MLIYPFLLNKGSDGKKFMGDVDLWNDFLLIEKNDDPLDRSSIILDIETLLETRVVYKHPDNGNTSLFFRKRTVNATHSLTLSEVDDLVKGWEYIKEIGCLGRYLMLFEKKHLDVLVRLLIGECPIAAFSNIEKNWQFLKAIKKTENVPYNASMEIKPLKVKTLARDYHLPNSIYQYEVKYPGKRLIIKRINNKFEFFDKNCNRVDWVPSFLELHLKSVFKNAEEYVLDAVFCYTNGHDDFIEYDEKNDNLKSCIVVFDCMTMNGINLINE